MTPFKRNVQSRRTRRDRSRLVVARSGACLLLGVGFLQGGVRSAGTRQWWQLRNITGALNAAALRVFKWLKWHMWWCVCSATIKRCVSDGRPAARASRKVTCQETRLHSRSHSKCHFLSCSVTFQNVRSSGIFLHCPTEEHTIGCISQTEKERLGAQLHRGAAPARGKPVMWDASQSH